MGTSKQPSITSKHRGRIDESLHAHAAGVDSDSPGAAALLRVTCYGPEKLLDKQNCSLARLRALRTR
jgi:hypothetical protein